MTAVTNWLALGGVVLTFLTALLGFWRLLRKVAEVHVLVNSQLKTVLDRVSQLTGTLEEAGVDVPVPAAEKETPT